MLVKEFRLRPGRTRLVGGQNVAEGDSVYLTENQARAFRDKFDPVDESDFKEMEQIPEYKPRRMMAKEDRQLPTEEAPQGQPVQQPPVPVRTAEELEGPVDITSVDPARQGQQTHEMRDVIDSGQAPLPATALKTSPTPPMPGQTPVPAAPGKENIGSGKDRK